VDAPSHHSERFRCGWLRFVGSLKSAFFRDPLAEASGALGSVAE
jgi:hypothetical protein